MMQIELSPAGRLRLWLNSTVSVDIINTGPGMSILCEILAHAERGEVKVGQPGAPTQSMIDDMVKRFYKAKPENVMVDLDIMELL